jgi:hypothetical protein
MRKSPVQCPDNLTDPDKRLEFDAVGRAMEPRRFRRCNLSIRKALNLARELNLLADEGDRARQDPTCGVLFGVIRDCAYKIQGLAEKEREIHLRNGKWS